MTHSPDASTALMPAYRGPGRPAQLPLPVSFPSSCTRLRKLWRRVFGADSLPESLTFAEIEAQIGRVRT